MDSSKITVLLPTSAIPSHPRTDIFEETFHGLKTQLPNAKIVVMADGVWSGIAHRREQYEEYLKLLEHNYRVHVVRFQQHTQQTGMCQYVIQNNLVQTPYIFFNEHDAPLRTDREIDWAAITHALDSKDAELIRLSYFEEGIHPEHEHLTRGRWRVDGCEFVRTVQFSGWPFMTTIPYFVNKIFMPPPIGVEMLEIRKYQDVANSQWEEYKIAVYCPDGPCQRFRHSNGRGAFVEERDPCDWG